MPKSRGFITIIALLLVVAVIFRPSANTTVTEQGTASPLAISGDAAAQSENLPDEDSENDTATIIAVVIVLIIIIFIIYCITDTEP